MCEEKTIRIMDMTNGDEVNIHFETMEEAEEWIDDQFGGSNRFMFMEEN